MEKFLNPMNDYAFKQVFGSVKSKNLLQSFLNNILELKKEKEIEEIEYLNPQQIVLPHEKQSIVDVLCKDKAGYRYIVEMQVERAPQFVKRAQYYTSCTYVKQLKRGDKYLNLKPVIFLGIMNHVIFPHTTEYKTKHMLLNTKTHTPDMGDFTYVFVELPKFKKTIKEIRTVEDRWIHFLKHASKDSCTPSQIRGTIVEEAYNILDKDPYIPKEGEGYMKYELELKYMKEFSHVLKEEMRPVLIKDTEFRSEMRKDPEFRSDIVKDPKFRSDIVKDPDFRSEMAKDNELKSEMMKDNKFKSKMRKDNEFKLEMAKDPSFKSEMMQDPDFQIELEQTIKHQYILDIAKKMLQAGLDNTTIAKLTKLTPKQIKDIS